MTATPSSRRRSTGCTIALFLGFSALLLASLTAYIVCLMPVKTAKDIHDWIPRHQGARYYIFAKKLITPILPAPATWWSPPQTCGEVGRGIWLAQGVVDLQGDNGEKIPSRWIVVFIPGHPEALYLRLGPREVGDLVDALGQAGIHKDKP